jgi:hypothetical protein
MQPAAVHDSQFNALVESLDTMADLVAYIAKHGPGCPDLVQLLLEGGADPNACTDDRFTPLHILSCWTGGEWSAGLTR